MPLRRGSASCARFAVQLLRHDTAQKDASRWCVKALKKLAFEPIDLSQESDESFGAVTSEVTTSTDFSAGTVFFEQQALFAFRFEKIRVSSSALKKAMQAWRSAFEAREHRRPSKTETADASASAKKALRAREEPRVQIVDVSFDVPRHMLTVWTTSRKRVDDVIEAIEKAFEVRLTAQVVATHFDLSVLEGLQPTEALFHPQEMR
jgi:DNA recombination-dependent growth factor C